MIRFIRMVQAMRTSGLDPVQALYLVWNEDISGTLAPKPSDIAALALTLRKDFAAVEATFVRKDDPTGSIAQALMALVYGASDTAFFFSLISGTYRASVALAYASPVAAADGTDQRRRPIELRRSKQAAHSHRLSRPDHPDGDQGGACDQHHRPRPTRSDPAPGSR